MSTLSDRVVAQLREAVDHLDLTGTRYQWQRLVGRGGMGSVYAVFDANLGREVALKVLTAGGTAGRLLAEARVVAQLEHPGIVPVYEAGVLVDGRAFYTMKLVEGVHLDAFIRGTPSLSDRLRVFQSLCDAVGFAHSRGVVHRDLKPANVMVGRFGEVLVVDPTRWLCKRIVGLPGERIESREGAIWIDDHLIAEPYIIAEFRSHDTWGPIHVAADEYFVLGDHRNNSSDSRTWGTVKRRLIWGRLLLRN